MNICLSSFKIKVSLLSIFFLLFLNNSSMSQTYSSPKWFSGTGIATGSNISKISKLALNRARKNALESNGIEITASKFMLKTGNNDKISDFFSQFIQANTHGLILDEKNVHFSNPVSVDSSSNPIDAIYKISCSVDCLIGSPYGQPDPNFDVTLKTDRDSYSTNEPAELTIKSTKPGYLTILDIHDDTVSVLFPNSLNKNNHLSANKYFIFPPGSDYSLKFAVNKGSASSADVIIAVVTKDNIPFPNIDQLDFKGSNLLLSEKSLTVYSNWLYKIPLKKRCADIKQVKVYK